MDYYFYKLLNVYIIPKEFNGFFVAGSPSELYYYQITYCEQTAEPRNYIFCIHMHVDKLCSSVHFYPNRQSP